MTEAGDIYEFVFRGQLADEALDQAGRTRFRSLHDLGEDLSNRLALDLLDDQLVATAGSMSLVYVAIAAFENSARKLVTGVLIDAEGEDWWAQRVSERIRRRAETRRTDEEKIRWHTSRGTDLIEYTDLSDLGNIVKNNWDDFAPFFPSIEWAASIFDILTRSRNVIMHSGVLGVEDIERVGINIRDWVRQVGV